MGEMTMNDTPELDLAEQLYAEGMKYNWRQSQSPANAALSRANLERAAALGHTKAIREFAEMMFAGSGGPKDEEQALWFKWSAFVKGDNESLEELATLLESYAENTADAGMQQRATTAARKAEEAHERLRSVRNFVHELIRMKLPTADNC
jgi:TPR repeat protein